MNAMNSLFGALPMPGRNGAGSPPPPEAALPALAPAEGWDEPWDDAEPPAEDEDDDPFPVPPPFPFPLRLAPRPIDSPDGA